MATVPFVYRFYPLGARGPRPGRRRQRRPAAAAARLATCRTGSRTGGHELAGRPGRRRPVPRVRRHRRALVRPGGVRHRAPDHPAGRPHDRGSAGPRRPRTPPPCCSRPTAAPPAVVVVSQISPGRKNRLWFSLDGARRVLAFDQENPEHLWIGSRDAEPGTAPRRRRPVRAGAADYSRAARPATRRATRTASTPSSPTPTPRSRGDRARRAAHLRRRPAGRRASPTPYSGPPRQRPGMEVPA